MPEAKTMNCVVVGLFRFRASTVYAAVSSVFVSRHLEQVTDMDTHTDWFVFCHPSLCFLRGPGCDAEWDVSKHDCADVSFAGLPSAIWHSQTGPLKTGGHFRQAWSQTTPGNNRPVAVVPLTTFHHLLNFNSANKSSGINKYSILCYLYLTATIRLF